MDVTNMMDASDLGNIITYFVEDDSQQADVIAPGDGNDDNNKLLQLSSERKKIERRGGLKKLSTELKNSLK